MTDIRKISVGKDYPNGAIHYQVGRPVVLVNVKYMITAILHEENSKGEMVYNIYISNDDGSVLWKEIKDMPTVTENNVNFE
jgi:hypothetical protein